MGLRKGSTGYNIQVAIKLLNNSSVGTFSFWNAMDPDVTIYNVYGFLPLPGSPGIGTKLAEYPTLEYKDYTVEMFIDDIRNKFIEWIETREEAKLIKYLLLNEDAQPDVPKRNVGKWIKVGDNSYRCSVCDEISCCNGNFCPDCGADMRKEEEDEQS